jgi:hypothetical protein
LRPPPRLPTWQRMWTRDQWHRFIDHPVVEWSIFVVGAILIFLSPLAGIIPGPGGIFVFAIGLAMVLKTSMWAKRRYVHFKRWQPKAGRWADWGLRRQSAKRRERIAKDREAMGCPPPAGDAAEGAIAGAIPAPPLTRPEMPGDSERAADRAD